MSVKERSEVVDTNYPRFYEFESIDSRYCRNCPAKLGTGEWEIAPKRILGQPVHTNWRQGENEIETVYICESPSNREISHSLPAVGFTGQGIFKSETDGGLQDGWLDELDNSIYRTNIVRCQADAGLQKRVDNTLKNKRVREASNCCINHLKDEIKAILNCRISKEIKKGDINVRFVIAIGKTGFSKLTKEVKEFLEKLKAGEYCNIEIEVTNHPSANTEEQEDE